ncbi:TPA: hypothetical protein ACH3X1_014759 [Trebouxia sp. C0004]
MAATAALRRADGASGPQLASAAGRSVPRQAAVRAGAWERPGAIQRTGRKAAEVTEPPAPAAKAQKAVAQQSATPWRDVLMGNSPDDRHTIQALIAEVEQLRKLIQNNQAHSNRTASTTTA